ncbi:hypothetical protein, partial [Botrimarina sp.]|uniref:hypothetical protein n=1 Tax=Botrimarina sp. TaxID=2795802 RepID=UPI0032ED4F39
VAKRPTRTTKAADTGLSGFLVTLHLFPGDDLPQGLFPTHAAAKRYAETVPLDKLVSTFGYCIDGREIEDVVFTITEFDGGRPAANSGVERSDFPRCMDATRDLSGEAQPPGPGWEFF